MSFIKKRKYSVVTNIKIMFTVSHRKTFLRECFTMNLNILTISVNRKGFR